jgi:hypothetical protein
MRPPSAVPSRGVPRFPLLAASGGAPTHTTRKHHPRHHPAAGGLPVQVSGARRGDR